MFDMARQISYWQQSSDEDWEVAQELVNNGRSRHGLFFAHLALEKLLKRRLFVYTLTQSPLNPQSVVAGKQNKFNLA